jgi:hypothetical protein
MAFCHLLNFTYYNRQEMSMKKLITILMVLATIMLLFGQAGNAPQAETKEVVAKGRGAILAGDEAKAQEDAVAAALRNAVENVVGTMVESNVLVENYQTVEDNIYTKTAGYVQKYNIISSSKQMDNTMEVTIRATVKLSDLRNDLEAIGVIIQRKGKPRLMVLVDEKNITENYGVYLSDLNVTETELMNDMMAFGFTFVDPQQSKVNIANDVVEAAMQGDANAAASIATRLGAEVIITGTAVAKEASGGPAVLRNSGMKSCQANMNLRAIQADNATIIATAFAYDNAAHIDEVTGGTQALQKAAKKAAEQLKDKIVAVWQKDVYSGGQVQLQVSNISTFTQLNTLKNNLKFYIRGVQAVNQRSFSGGTALFDIDTKGTGEQLASELESKEIEGLKLRVISVTANKVSAQIVQPTE